MNNTVITILSSLFSGILATIITLIVTYRIQQKNDNLNYKKEVFKMLIAYRGDLTDSSAYSGGFQIAMNQVFVAYNDSKQVLTAFENFRKETINGVDRPESNKHLIGCLVTLLKAMANDINIDYNFSNDDLFTTPIVIHKKNILTITNHPNNNHI